MKKKTLFSIVVCSIFSVVTVGAYYSQTGWTLSPEFELNQVAKGTEHTMVSRDATLRVGECYTEFTSGYLEPYHYKQPHDFPIYLMDADGTGSNDDDLLKIYEGMFEADGTMPYVEYRGLGPWAFDEAVDWEGDDRGELYVQGTLKAINDEEVNLADGRKTEMFEYRISVD